MAEEMELKIWPLPLQGRPERQHLYEWIAGEEDYVANKFDDQRDGHDDALASYDLEEFWARQIGQYVDRARQFLRGALEEPVGSTARRHFEMLAQQALAKGMMTFKGCVESSIRVFGPLPKPGVSSGNIDAEPWTVWPSGG